MPLERPIRRPIVGADGKMDRLWADYFDNLDVDQEVSTDFERESLFIGQDAGLGAEANDEARRLKVRMTTAETDINAVEVRATALEADVRELQFLGA